MDVLPYVSESIVLKYRKLLLQLHRIYFTYKIPMDANRYEDGIALRYRFGVENDIHPAIISQYLDTTPCSILEMMCALAIRCEEQFMSDPDLGNRTAEWFWCMILSLGLKDMDNDKINNSHVHLAIDKFLNHKYSRNGRGGLFTIRGTEYDMRTIEIWDQLMLYLNYIDQ